MPISGLYVRTGIVIMLLLIGVINISVQSIDTIARTGIDPGWTVGFPTLPESWTDWINPLFWLNFFNQLIIMGLNFMGIWNPFPQPIGFLFSAFMGFGWLYVFLTILMWIKSLIPIPGT